MPAELSQGRGGESSGGRRWRAGSEPARVTAAVRAGHGQECHQICTPPTTLNLQHDLQEKKHQAYEILNQFPFLCVI